MNEIDKAKLDAIIHAFRAGATFEGTAIILQAELQAIENVQSQNLNELRVRPLEME